MPRGRVSWRRAKRWCWRGLACALAASLLSAPAPAAPTIARPAVDATVHSNSGDVQVAVRDVPAGALLQPLLDGVVASPPVAASTLVLHGVVRGDHLLVVRIVDADGRELGRTTAVRFHVFHASRQMRRSVR